ncbi:MAG: hypothetical protein A2249_00190 [Candidatus Jacksonbacteria bacterium RIFOXYA2_FULL_44_7]|uniref:NodB homology domain-containing protein n=1 Tax=Candidatus Jacksonbacteria bacterium RIFCSPLOWO2_02_FULL_44_20 TaxID=1798460 RepID=A0A1G2A7A2_9BACT|nr:MAG: hypothetical protein UW39_C0002G0031 [Parcubacteria group bacterium GW2011_GWC2_44_17]KKT50074.1 MAG: hypothetical protein UW40_C0010G0025 [Parcubacteria group bacterium GW2011_GWF2_44_17]OGY69499.1 MAG: hypothetical protein A3C00_00355 [Candidatus Jacksonbacteria bacterium RIFCSPHIGHO2_02_FULL_44_25]OGY71532.1 MAG: hypothetical protein A3E05_04230 [Candidatus Jacksonbacteria bacterium RIFCSPHIGHO2_12_FULL_44_12]OGY72783.1 MAG: hypothetical protein A3H61_02415 [Candidatus Jacksonbacteri
MTSPVKQLSFPHGKKFAFSIFDDTDDAIVETVQPIYDLLYKLNIKTTKSVWVFRPKEPKNIWRETETLEDSKYLTFIKTLHDRGFEIALHNVSADPNERKTSLAGLEKFRDWLGFYPTSHCNHVTYNTHQNDALYWGYERISNPFLRQLFKRTRFNSDSKGHDSGSKFFWGDIAARSVRYVRNLTFNDINTLKINPSLPYHEPQKPYVPFWFSSSDGRDVTQFNKLLSIHNQERIERERGVCIVYTHFAYNFVKNKTVHPETQLLLETLAKKDGWFVPVTELLDWLKEQRDNETIPKQELTRMEYRWFWEKFLEKIVKL